MKESLFKNIIKGKLIYKIKIKLFNLKKNNYTDEEYILKLSKIKFKKSFDLVNPKTFNEKINWLKINFRENIFTLMVDKYEVKNIISKQIGDNYVIKTIGVFNSSNEIDVKSLPDKFVIKCTHDSGSVFICKDKKSFDFVNIFNKLDNNLKGNYYYNGREWPYKNVQPRILIEELLENKGKSMLNVYKIFNFNGNPEIIQVIQNDKLEDETIDYFDCNWNLLNLRQNFPNSKETLGKPQKLDEMLALAKKLSKGFPFIRTDFYEVDNKVYFSEFTFYSDSGFAKFNPEEWDIKLGNMMDLNLCEKFESDFDCTKYNFRK